MSETITPRRFHEADWRVVRDDACTHFRTGSFAAGVALVDAIGRLADAANHHPDVDLRSEGVTVRLRSHSGDDGLSERDVSLAIQISAAARELGVPVDLTGLQTVQVAIDALVLPDVVPFWRAVLGYQEVGGEDLLDPHFGAAVLVPADGCAAPAAQPDPHRCLCAARPGGGARSGGDRRGWASGQRRERAPVVDPGRRRGQ
jgi:4a-hydroxytetrahydrobiopterin dehydratase